MYLKAIIKNQDSLSVSVNRKHNVYKFPLKDIVMSQKITRKCIEEPGEKIELQYCHINKTNQDGTPGYCEGFMLELDECQRLVDSVNLANRSPFLCGTNLVAVHKYHGSKLVPPDITLIRREDITHMYGTELLFTNNIVMNGRRPVSEECMNIISDMVLVDDDRHIIESHELREVLRAICAITYHITAKDSNVELDDIQKVLYSLRRILDAIAQYGYSSLSIPKYYTLKEDLNRVFDILRRVNITLHESINTNLTKFIDNITKENRAIINKVELYIDRRVAITTCLDFINVNFEIQRYLTTVVDKTTRDKYITDSNYNFRTYVDTSLSLLELKHVYASSGISYMCKHNAHVNILNNLEDFDYFTKESLRLKKNNI